MRFNLVASLAVLLGASFAQAQVAPAMDVEYFHQAPAGVFELRPHLNYMGATGKVKPPATSDTKINGISDLGARFEYGFNEMFSLYGDLSVSMLETKLDNNASGQATVSSSGLDDIELGFRGTNAMGMGSLRYGLALNLGLENAKLETDFFGRKNNSSGGYNLMPYVGYDMAVGPGFWGARLSYQWMGERSYDMTKSVAGNFNGKIKEGHVLGLGTFYEYLLSDMILGGRVQFDIPGNVKVTGAPVLGEFTAENSNNLTLGVYTRIPMGPGVLLAGFDYSMLMGKRWLAGPINGVVQDNYDSFNTWNLNVGYRIAF